MPKPTCKPVYDELVGSHTLVRGIRELEDTLRSTLYATLGIQGFALMLLLLCTVHVICSPLSVGKLSAEFLVGPFEMCDFAA